VHTPHRGSCGHDLDATGAGGIVTADLVEDDHVRIIMDRFGMHAKTEAVALALRHLAGQPMTREQALALRGARAIGEVPADVAPRGAA
jgi:hypothetical protein